MQRCFAIVVTVSALASAAPVLAQSPLALSAGLTAEQAQGLTLREIAAVKFNRGVSAQDQQTVTAQQVPGSNPELVAFGLETYNAGQSFSDRVPYRTRSAATDMAFQEPIDVSRHYHLIRAAGLTPEQAEGMTLNQIVHIISPD